VPALALAGLLAVFAAMLVLSMAASWQVTFGPLLQALANLFDQVTLKILGRTIVGLGFLGDAVRSFDASMERSIGAAVGVMGAPLARVFRVVRNVVVYPADELAGLSRDVAETLWQLRRVIVPAMIAAKIAWISKHLAALEHQAVHVVKTVTHVVTHETVRIATHTTKVVVSKAVAVPLPRIGRLEREVTDLGKRIRSLANRGAAVVGLGLIAASLARLGLGWPRCSKEGKVGKQVCGMDQDLLDALLADATLIAGTVSLVEFAKEMQAGVGDVSAAVRLFWRA